MKNRHIHIHTHTNNIKKTKDIKPGNQFKLENNIREDRDRMSSIKKNKKQKRN